MDLDRLLSLGKQHQRIIEDIPVHDNADIKRRILAQLSQYSPMPEVHRASKTSWIFQKRRTVLIGASCVLPFLFGFAGYQMYEKWSGTHVAKSTQNEGPSSFWADPDYLKYELEQSGTQTYSLSEASKIAGIPLQKPVNVSGWKNIFSKGLIFEQKGYQLLPNQTLKLTHVGETSLVFVDIYQNSAGKRIAVSQQIQSMMTTAREQGKLHSVEVNPTLEVGADWQVTLGFRGDLVYWVSGSWSDLPGKQVFHGKYENIVAYMRVTNRAVKEVDIDGYGNVGKSQLLTFAHEYLH